MSGLVALAALVVFAAPLALATELPLLFVSSKATNSVLVYDGRTGQFIRTFADAGSGLTYPNGIAVDTDGHVYVSSVETNSIMQYALATGQLLATYSNESQLSGPVDLLLKDDTSPQHLLVASYSTGSVLELDPASGTWSTLVSPGLGGLSGASGLQRAPNGDLLVCSEMSHQVLEFDWQTGAFVRVAAEGSSMHVPCGIVYDDQGNLLVSRFDLWYPEWNAVLRFAPDGAYLGEFVPGVGGDLFGAQDIIWGFNGNLLVCNRWDMSVAEFDRTTGAFVRILAQGGGLDEPTYMALARVWDTDCNGNSVPDRWDIELGLAQDCNLNGIPDSCDIQSGLSPDANQNGIPDECEACLAHETARLARPMRAQDDKAGWSVALDADVALVGVPMHDTPELHNIGGVWVFRYDGRAWQPEQLLLASGGQLSDEFGYSVATAGGIAVVGAPQARVGYVRPGAAYVFHYDPARRGWTQVARLLAARPVHGDAFGSSVGICGDTIVVGAPTRSAPALRSGAAFVFCRPTDGWHDMTETACLTASDGAAYDNLAGAVAIDGDTIVCGARWHDAVAANCGAAYIFEKPLAGWSTMTETERLVSGDATADDQFGISVALSGDFALIGAHQDDQGGSNAGAAYVFHRGPAGWTQETKLSASDALAGAEFGITVSLSENIALIGAHLDRPAGLRTGSAYVYRQHPDGWVEEVKLTASDAAADDYFGWAVAVAHSTAVVGAWGNDEAGDTDTGVAYVFRGLFDCNATGSLDICDLARDPTLDQNHNGIPDECDDCNANGIPDWQEIANGSSPDCNSNHVPDECDLADGTSRDCNADGIPDECQLTGDVHSRWIADQSGLWTTPENWCPAHAPNNDAGATYDVVIDRPDALVTLDMSPTLDSVACAAGATVEVNAQSGADVRFIAAGEPIANAGTIRARDARRLLIDAADLNQADSGLIEAVGQAGEASKIQVNGRRVVGGTLRTQGDSASIELLGGAILQDVIVEGNVIPRFALVVPDGNGAMLAGTIDDRGGIRVAAAERPTWLAPDGDVSLNGTSAVALTHPTRATLGGFAGSVRNGPGHRIEGTGIVFGAFTNAAGALVEANVPDATLWLAGPGAKRNDGVLRAAQGGILTIDTAVTGTGDLEAVGAGSLQGRLNIESATVGVHSLHIAGGAADFDHALVACDDGVDLPPTGPSAPIGVLRLTAATLHGVDGLFLSGGVVSAAAGSQIAIEHGPVSICPDLLTDPAAVAELDLADAASTLDCLSLRSCAPGRLTVSGIVTVAANITFDNTQVTEWLWQPTSRLRMIGGVGLSSRCSTGYAGLEVGGADLGFDPLHHVGAPQGFVDNFALAVLEIGPGAHVTLVDALDNGHRNGSGGAAEALYVDRLEFADSAGRLNLGGLHLYYNSLVGDETQILDLPNCGPQPHQTSSQVRPAAAGPQPTRRR